MTSPWYSLHAILERYNIHAATCRPRQQGLACSHCAELLERVLRALRAAAAEAV